MTDQQLAEAYVAAETTERAARLHMAAVGEDLAERDAALVAVRQSHALVMCLQRWMAARQRRAHALPVNR